MVMCYSCKCCRMSVLHKSNKDNDMNQSELICFVFVLFSSVAIVVDSLEPLWAAVLPPARVISTSCVLEPKTVCSSRTGRCSATSTGTLLVQRCGYNFPSSFSLLFGLIIVKAEVN